MNPALVSVIVPAGIGGLCGLVGALCGSVVGPIITFRLNERTRKLELYKIIFPELFKAVQKLAADAHALEREVWHHQNYEAHTAQAEQNCERIVPAADALILYAYSFEYLLGPEVKHEARNFGIASKESVGWQDPEVYPIANCNYTTAYERLVKALRLAARIPVVESVFPAGHHKAIPMVDEL